MELNFCTDIKMPRQQRKCQPQGILSTVSLVCSLLVRKVGRGCGNMGKKGCELARVEWGKTGREWHGQ